MQEIYVVPNINDSGYDYSQSFEVPRPQPLSSALLSDTVKIQRLSGNQWIFITNSPAEVWPQVREFLGNYNIPVATTDAENGIIDTQWLAFNDAPDMRNRFRLRIETGVQPESSEIHILQMQAPANAPIGSDAVWPKNSENPAREAWMIDELSNTLASNLERSTSSLLAQTIGGDDKAFIGKSDSNEPILRLKLSFARAWASTMHALDEEGFHTFDNESSLGVFYVAYQEPVSEEDKPGWIKRSYRAVKGAFGGKSDPNAAPTTPYTLADVLSHLPNDDDTREVFTKTQGDGNTLKDVPGYLVLVRGVDGEIEIRIRDGYAQRIDDKEAKQLLGMVRNNLI